MGPGAAILTAIPAERLSLRKVMADVASDWSFDDWWVSTTIPIGGAYQGEGRPFSGQIFDLSHTSDQLLHSGISAGS
jgi:hypothetical protein